MSRYVVMTRRDTVPQGTDQHSALSALSSFPGIRIVGYADPNTVTIDTDEQTAEKLTKALSGTHYVEPEIRRGLH
jgi:hypothetical protein